jgi:hypothetical protein
LFTLDFTVWGKGTWKRGWGRTHLHNFTISNFVTRELEMKSEQAVLPNPCLEEEEEEEEE